MICCLKWLTFQYFITVPLQVRDELHTEFVACKHALHFNEEVHGLGQTLVVAKAIVLLDDLRRPIRLQQLHVLVVLQHCCRHVLLGHRPGVALWRRIRLFRFHTLAVIDVTVTCTKKMLVSCIKEYHLGWSLFEHYFCILFNYFWTILVKMWNT